MRLDAETYAVLGYQAMSTWDLNVAIEINAALRRERVRRNDTRPRAKRPEKCPSCSKPLKQDLGSRVRRYCNRKCQRAANRAEQRCACGKPLGDARVWCSERCRKADPEVKKKLNAARKKRRALFGRKDRERLT